MTLTSIVTSEGCAAEVTGVGYNALGEVKIRNNLSVGSREVRQSIYDLLEVSSGFDIETYLCETLITAN